MSALERLGTEDGIEITRRTMPLDHPLVEKHLALGPLGRVMIHVDDRYTRGTHFKARRDELGWYVRMGKRGTCKERLDRCEVTYLDGEPTIYQFRLRRVK